MMCAVVLRTGERTGVLVIRVWFEPCAGVGLRARITGTLDLSERDETVTVCSTPEGIADVVIEWIDTFVGSAAEVTER